MDRNGAALGRPGASTGSSALENRIYIESRATGGDGLNTRCTSLSGDQVGTGHNSACECDRGDDDGAKLHGVYRWRQSVSETLVKNGELTILGQV